MPTPGVEAEIEYRIGLLRDRLAARGEVLDPQFEAFHRHSYLESALQILPPEEAINFQRLPDENPEVTVLQLLVTELGGRVQITRDERGLLLSSRELTADEFQRKFQSGLELISELHRQFNFSYIQLITERQTLCVAARYGISRFSEEDQVLFTDIVAYDENNQALREQYIGAAHVRHSKP